MDEVEEKLEQILLRFHTGTPMDGDKTYDRQSAKRDILEAINQQITKAKEESGIKYQLFQATKATSNDVAWSMAHDAAQKNNYERWIQISNQQDLCLKTKLDHKHYYYFLFIKQQATKEKDERIKELEKSNGYMNRLLDGYGHRLDWESVAKKKEAELAHKTAECQEVIDRCKTAEAYLAEVKDENTRMKAVLAFADDQLVKFKNKAELAEVEVAKLQEVVKGLTGVIPNTSSSRPPSFSDTQAIIIHQQKVRLDELQEVVGGLVEAGQELLDTYERALEELCELGLDPEGSVKFGKHGSGKRMLDALTHYKKYQEGK